MAVHIALFDSFTEAEETCEEIMRKVGAKWRLLQPKWKMGGYAINGIEEATGFAKWLTVDDLR